MFGRLRESSGMFPDGRVQSASPDIGRISSVNDAKDAAAILNTRRLRVREFAAEDLDVLAAMVADEEQMRFYPRRRTRDEAWAWISRNLRLYEEHGFGFWLIESRSTSMFLGYCGIRPLVIEGVWEMEIGWHTTKMAWNQGIATEVALAVRDLAFTRFSQPRLMALIHPDNLASRRVADKIGMCEQGTIVVEGDPYVTYAIEPQP
jgi:[ribosomal protein S5]-alanine N-acetyltransferase